MRYAPPANVRLQGIPGFFPDKEDKTHCGRLTKGHQRTWKHIFLSSLKDIPWPKALGNTQAPLRKIPGFRTVERPAQAEEHTEKAFAVAMAARDGLDATMPLDQR